MVVAGNKRKRHDGAEAQLFNPASREPTNIQRELAARASIDKCHTQLISAFKVSRGFERQKLGRRRKQAGGQEALSRLEQEKTALKQLDLDAVARNYLIKSLLKVKGIAESDALPGYARRTVPDAISGAAALNVVARLCGSEPVRKVVPSIIAEVQRALGVSERKNDQKTKDGGKAAKVVGSEDEEEDEFEGFSDRIADEGDTSDEELDKRRQDLRSLLEPGTLGSDSDDDSDGNEHDSDSDDYLSNRKSARAVGPIPSVSRSPTPSDPISRSPSPQPRRFDPTSSAFLPSLTMGGYISGSDTDKSDIDAQAQDLTAPPRKNKRGQRARRAIWEQKYKDKAKHLGKEGAAQPAQGGKGQGRDAGWDAKRGATDGPRWKNARGAMPSKERHGDAGSGVVRPVAKKPRVKDDQGPLHPSWEAAKKAKAAKENVTAAFQGKRVTFD